MKEGKAPRVNAVHRGLQILELLAGQKKGWSTSEISRKLKIPKSTASYLLHTLLARGYLRREADGVYRLSMKLLALGGLALKGVEIREIALPILRRLVAETGSTAHLAVLEGTEAVYIERVASPGFIQMDTWVGRRMCLHSTSAGKALLAYLPEELAEANLQVTGLPRFTPKTIVSFPKLKQELKRIRESGFAVDDEENTPGVRCLAAPVFDRAGTAVAAISLTGPVQQVTEDRLMRIVEKVKEAARQMTHLLGGSFQPAIPRKNAWNLNRNP
jgi:DNA-binding IclR family transcriptional regulator